MSSESPSNETNPITAKKKALIARQIRTSLGPRISDALGIPIEEIQFTDDPRTSELDIAFTRGMKDAGVHVFPDRNEAFEFVLNDCPAISGPGVWLVDDFHLGGAVEVELGYAIERLHDLLLAQGEFVRLMSRDGKQGLCISSEEGKEDHHERHVVIWR